jgi:hypothetical protein
MDIAFLFSPTYTSGLKGIKKLFYQNAIGYDFPELDREFFYKFLEKMHKKDNLEYFDIMENYRPRNATIQNIRDAKALQYIEEINNKYLEKNDILIFLSSSQVFQRMDDSNDLEINKQIDGRSYPLFRDTMPFYTALIELCNIQLINKNPGKNLKLSKEELKSLLEHINRDLSILQNFLNITEDAAIMVLSGRFKYLLEDTFNKLDELKSFIEKRERTDLLFLFDYKNFITYKDLNLDVYSENIVYLEKICEEIKRDSFQSMLIERIKEFEQEQIEFLNWTFSNFNLSSYKAFPFGYEEFYVILIGTFDGDISDFSPKNVEIKSSNAILPEHPGMVQINERFILYEIYGKNMHLFVIENQLDKCNIYILNIYYIWLTLSIIISKLQKDYINTKYIKEMPLRKLIKELILPLGQYKNIEFDKKDDIIDMYLSIINVVEK